MEQYPLLLVKAMHIHHHSPCLHTFQYCHARPYELPTIYCAASKQHRHTTRCSEPGRCIEVQYRASSLRRSKTPAIPHLLTTAHRAGKPARRRRYQMTTAYKIVTQEAKRTTFHSSVQLDTSRNTAILIRQSK